jgi:hypothetical protein
MIVINIDEKASDKATVEQQKTMHADYMKYTEELQKAGVMRAGDALEPSSSGARVSFEAGRRIVRDGPFTEAKEVIGGYYLIDVKSREEAIEWAAKCPGAKLASVEVRSVRIFTK